MAAAVRGDVSMTPVGEVTAVLGEGPYWAAEGSCLLWVDVQAGLLHRTEVPSGETTSATIAEVSAAFPAAGGGLAYTAGHQLVRRVAVPGQAGLSGEFTDEVIAAVPGNERLRFNDAAVDPAGRVWAGTMDKRQSAPLGTLYRLDPGRVLTPVVSGVTVSNGLGWSPDGTRLYYSDTPTRRVDVLSYDPATGDVAGRRVFCDLSEAGGFPDGLTVDADGHVWVCMWDGGALLRIDPSGVIALVITMPVARPTSLAFGGEDLADLYVTTARVNLTADQLADQPLAGRLLQLRPGPAGQPATTTAAVVPS